MFVLHCCLNNHLTHFKIRDDSDCKLCLVQEKMAVIEVDKKIFKVKSIEGDTFLGGRDFDKKIMDEYEKEMIKKCGDKIKEKLNKKLCSIRNSCVNLKISLSTKHSASFRHTDISDWEKSVELLRADFENFSADLVQRAKNLLEKCLKNVKISKDDIDLVLLVGGTTRIPKVKEMLNSYFGKEKLKTNLNPDEAVALGATIAAVNSQEFEKCKITEITPLSLGLSLEGDLMKVLIEKNTLLPAKSKPVKLHTVNDP